MSKTTSLWRGLALVGMALGLAACASATSSPGAASASCAHTYTLKYTNTEALPTPEAKAMYSFQTLVEHGTNGCVKVTLYPGGVLASASEELPQVESNVAQMTPVNGATLSTYEPKYNFFQIPMIFSDASSVENGLKSQPVATLDNAFLAKTGLRVLAWETLGFVQFLNSVHPIVKPSDVAGLKFRIIPGSQPLQQSLTDLGADPVPVVSAEMYEGEQSGLINANEEPPSIFQQYKDYENLKYMTVLNYQYNPEAIVINNSAFTALPKSYQQVVTNAAVESSNQEVTGVDQQNDAAERTFAQNGVQVTTLTSAQRQQFLSAIRGYLKSTVSTYGPALFEAFGVNPNQF
jgi:TRAP-type C4-dicarboxylate transport system substrate-binding protein